jgi:hypothetical protein
MSATDPTLRRSRASVLTSANVKPTPGHLGGHRLQQHHRRHVGHQVRQRQRGRG